MKIESLDVASSRPVFVKTSGGKMIQLEKHQAVWNMSKNELGCVASDQYNIIQHRDVVRSLFKALKALNIKYESRVMKNGNKMILDVKFPEVKVNVKKGEEFIGGLRLINSYNKTTGVVAVSKLERLVCSNGMTTGSIIPGFNINHTSDMVFEFEDLIQKFIKTLINSSEKLREVVERCIGDSVEWKILENILKVVVKRDKHIEKIVEGMKEKKTINRWEIYNAITSYASHDKQLSSSLKVWLEKKAEKLLLNPLQSFEERYQELEELQVPQVQGGK